jgi:hypothetical protein
MVVVLVYELDKVAGSHRSITAVRKKGNQINCDRKIEGSRSVLN